MDRRGRRLVWAGAVYLILAVAALGSSGCLLVAAGAAAGGAVGYFYYQGNRCGTYDAGFNDTWTALHTALRELGMPIAGEDTSGGELEARTADGQRLRMTVQQVAGRVPGENPLTRVCVRVATFGDEEVSEAILRQVSAHLVVVPPGPAQAAFGPPQTAPPPLADAAPAQTAPPPLLPSRPAPIQPAGK